MIQICNSGQENQPFLDCYSGSLILILEV